MMRNPGFSRIILSISRNGRTNEFCYSSSLSPLVTEGGVKDRRDYPWIVNEPVKGITYDLPSEERPDQDHHQASGRGAPPFLPPFLIPPSLPPFLPPPYSPLFLAAPPPPPPPPPPPAPSSTIRRPWTSLPGTEEQRTPEEVIVDPPPPVEHPAPRDKGRGKELKRRRRGWT